MLQDDTDTPQLAGMLRSVLDLVDDGVVVCDQNGVEVMRNATALRQLGSKADGVLAEQAVSEALREALSGEYHERSLELFAPAARRLVIKAFPLPASGGAVAVVKDASDRHRLESIRRDFVANVSHELKTPVGALSLLAETLDGEEDPEVVARLAARISSEAERLGRIIDDLLDLSRIEANDSPRQEIVPIAVIIGQAVEPLRSVAASVGVDVEVGDVPKHVAIPGDRRDLVSAVSNLVDNAIKYSEHESLIRIEVRSDEPWVEIDVSDQGVGIPSRDLERIFERFYRVDRARSRSTGGTGLGLSIVRHVTVNHGGTVKVDSVEGKGSTFTLKLPAVNVSHRGGLVDRNEASPADFTSVEQDPQTTDSGPPQGGTSLA